MILNLLFLLLQYNFETCQSSNSLGRNNACKSFPDYLNPDNNKNCFYNPDMSLEVPELIVKYAGKSETHQVKTKDGYILTLFRIPRENPTGVVLLQHSLGVDSRVWVGQGNDSLAFYLWNGGYEIWLGNARGTPHSQRHTTFSISNFHYWNFSFHEIGIYDIPSQLKLIREFTNSKVIYIGHSQGSIAGLIYGSLMPEEAKNFVDFFVFMATPGYYTHITSPTRFFVPFESLIRDVIDTLKLGNVLILPFSELSKSLFRLFPPSLPIVDYFISFLLGWTPEQADPAIFNFDFGVYLKDFSWKLLLHYLQLVKSRMRFQQYDYGRQKNFEYYHSEVPPTYPLENFSVPVYFVSSYDDSLTSLQDSDLYIRRMQNTTKILGHLKVSGLNHFDYHFGRNRREILFQKLLKILDSTVEGNLIFK